MMARRQFYLAMRSLIARGGWMTEGGYTIVESVVALSVLVTVLIPLAGTLTYFVSQHRNEELATALAVGRHHMEELLFEAAAINDVAHVADSTWRVIRRTSDIDGVRTFSVDVYRGKRLILELDTWRRTP